MKTVKKYILLFSLAMFLVPLQSCEKFLEVKPQASLSTPETLEDLRALLDEESFINRHYPGLIEMGTDDYFLDYSVLISRTPFDQAVYLWESEPLYLSTNVNLQWRNPYQGILYSNIVLESLDRIKEGTYIARDNLKGEALFVRGYALYYLAQLYCAPYDVRGDNGGLGIPLRLSSDFNVKTSRATVEETYNHIINDLTLAISLLPDHVDYKTRANKTAAYAALARIYLAMEEYELANNMANEALKRYAVLIDLNDLNIDISYPFTAMHDETLYLAYSTSGSLLLSPTRANISDELFQSYDDNDLRKKAYFYDKGNGYIGFKGNYAGNNSSYFAGLATDELFLIRAECRARFGEVNEAMDDLNHLLKMRWRTGTFTPFQADNADAALKFILKERRKELVFRGVRWSDIRRLNKDDRFATTLVREVNDGNIIKTYTLPPNDLRFIYLIPQEIILKTGIEQNPRL